MVLSNYDGRWCMNNLPTEKKDPDELAAMRQDQLELGNERWLEHARQSDRKKRVRGLCCGVVVTLVLIAAASYWGHQKVKENNRRTCLFHIRNMQVAVRSHNSVHGIGAGQPYDMGEVLEFLKIEMPQCPSGGIYRYDNIAPLVGSPVLRCSCPGHKHEDTEGW